MPKIEDMGGDEDYAGERICSECHGGVLGEHPSVYGLLKCPICGFTKKDPTKTRDRISGD